MNKRKRLLLVLGLGVALFAFFLFTRPSAPTPRVLPNPNGYDELLSAAKRLPSPMPELASLNDQDLREFLRTNAATIQLFREALQKPCVVSEWPMPENPYHADNVVKFKSIALCFAATGRIAEKDGLNSEAASAYLDTIRLGANGLHEGVIIDRLVGTACESIGIRPLKTLVEKLSATECRQAITALQKLDEQREPYEKTLASEKEFIRRVGPSLSQQIASLVMFRSQRNVAQKTLSRINGAILLERQTMLSLAAHAYTLENGKSPKDALDLVPNYLKVIPQDPTTKTNLAL
jgi:hypothetical protein